MKQHRSRTQATTTHVPAVLPRIVVTPAPSDDKAYILTVNDGASSQGPVAHTELGQAIANAAEQLRTAVRVEIHDPSGRVHADIIHPPRHDHDEGRTPAQPERKPSCAGFIPGEDVRIAIVDHTETADHTGAVAVDVTHKPGAPRRETILVGVTSGTVLVVRPR